MYNTLFSRHNRRVRNIPHDQRLIIPNHNLHIINNSIPHKYSRNRDNQNLHTININILLKHKMHNENTRYYRNRHLRNINSNQFAQHLHETRKHNTQLKQHLYIVGSRTSNILHLHKMPIGIVQNKIRITKVLHVHPNILIVLQIDFL